MWVPLHITKQLLTRGFVAERTVGGGLGGFMV
jgi:hypothetical protein